MRPGGQFPSSFLSQKYYSEQRVRKSHYITFLNLNGTVVNSIWRYLEDACNCGGQEEVEGDIPVPKRSLKGV